VALGGAGIVSVASNEIPREMAEMTRAALNNDWASARQLQRKYLALMQANFMESNPMPVKAVLAMMGKIEEVYRLPMLPMRRDTRSKLQRIVAEAGLIAKPAGSPSDRTRPQKLQTFSISAPPLGRFLDPRVQPRTQNLSTVRDCYES